MGKGCWNVASVILLSLGILFYTGIGSVVVGIVTNSLVYVMLGIIMILVSVGIFSYVRPLYGGDDRSMYKDLRAQDLCFKCEVNY